MDATANKGPCPICDGEVTLGSGTVLSEIIHCRECGCQLEVKALDPLELAEAPAEEEDWGE